MSTIITRIARTLAERNPKETIAKLAMRGRRQQTRSYASDPNHAKKAAYPWLDPSNPSNWKEEHLVFVILGGWGFVGITAKTLFT
jgi:hypothetical protein